ncbi:MAG TPA: nicotinamide-nucleotide amidohydrolase family protein [Wenzhouxiangella sp.]
MEQTHNDQVLAEHAFALASALKAGGQTLALAESCTGGWVAKLCTDLAGSSNWFERGFVTYSNEAKQELLGVDAQLIEQQGAVSEPVAAQMALGAQQRARVDCAIAITGIAGPGGGSPDKPVGTVCFGWVLGDGVVETERHLFAGDRDAIRRASVAGALMGLLERLRAPLRF